MYLEWKTYHQCCTIWNYIVKLWVKWGIALGSVCYDRLCHHMENETVLNFWIKMCIVLMKSLCSTVPMPFLVLQLKLENLCIHSNSWKQIFKIQRPHTAKRRVWSRYAATVVCCRTGFLEIAPAGEKELLTVNDRKTEYMVIHCQVQNWGENKMDAL